MLKAVLIIFVLLWLLGFIHVSFLAIPIIGAFTFQSLLYLIVIVFLISLLPGIFRTIAIVIFILWLLSSFGFLILGGFSNLILLILILVVVFAIV